MSKKPKLYNFQIEGTQRAVKALVSEQIETVGGSYRKGHCFLLHDEMGLGKTIQAFETLTELIKQGHNGSLPVLIVVPSSCIHIWSKNEYYSQDFDVRIFLKEGKIVENSRFAFNPPRRLYGNNVKADQSDNHYNLLRYASQRLQVLH